MVYNQSLSIKVKQFKAHTYCINRIKQSPFNNSYVATISSDNETKIWNVATSNGNWSLIQTFTGHTKDVFGFEWINEDTLATGSLDGTIKLWSICTGRLLYLYMGNDFLMWQVL